MPYAEQTSVHTPASAIGTSPGTGGGQLPSPPGRCVGDAPRSGRRERTHRVKTRTILNEESVLFEGPSGGGVQMLHPGIHPGLMLFEEIAERGLSPAGLARLLGVTTARISSVERCRSPVTAELALLLGKAFGQSPRFWLAQQAERDLWVAGEKLGDRLARLTPIGTMARKGSALN